MARAKIEAPEELIEKLAALDPSAGDYVSRVRAHCLGALTRLSLKKYSTVDGSPKTGLSLTSKRRAISRYRVAIREVLGDHIALKYMRLKDTDQDSVHDADRKRVVKQHRSRRALNVARHIEIAREVLSRAVGDTPPLEVAAALIAVTGRRPSEVLRDLTPHGDFTERTGKYDDILFDASVKEHNRWSIVFHGQRKTRDSESARGAYEIPTLVEPSLVFRALRFLRSVYSQANKTDEQISSNTSSHLGKYAKGGHHGFATQKSPGYSDIDGLPLNPKDLRAAYATCAYELFAPRNVTWNAYCSFILGHTEQDILTSFSYDVFYPHKAKSDYDKKLRDAAKETLRSLQRSLQNERDEVKRGYIEEKITSVQERLQRSR